MNEIHPYLRRHTERYFNYRKAEPERALDCLQRIANFLDWFDPRTQKWTLELEVRAVAEVTKIQRQIHQQKQ